MSEWQIIHFFYFSLHERCLNWMHIACPIPGEALEGCAFGTNIFAFHLRPMPNSTTSVRKTNYIPAFKNFVLWQWAFMMHMNFQRLYI